MNIHIDGITKRYGSVCALDRVSFSLGSGECFCLVGRNGAGKSTLIHVMAGIAEPDAGAVLYDGDSIGVDPVPIKRRLGVLPDQDATIPELTGAEYLELVALLQGLPSWQETPSVAHLAKRLLESEDVLHRRTAAYSRGMRVKLGICAALLHDPDCLLFDEPFSSLDPVSAADLTELLRELRGEGKTILVSSHNLAQVEQLATHVGLIDRGRLVFAGTLEEFTAGHAGSVERSLLERLGPDAAGTDVAGPRTVS